MSEINATFVVDSVQLTITPQEPSITITPEPIELRLFTGGFSNPGGNTGELQYNAGGFLEGVPTSNYSNGVLLLGSDSNIKITGGNNGYFLQTDGTGNLTWQAGTGNVTGNGVPGGANTQIQFNDQGNFGGAAGLTFDTTSNIFTAPGEILASSSNITTMIANTANIVNINISDNANINNVTVSGTTTIQQAKEKVFLDSTPAAGTVNFYLLDQAIIYKTADANSNFTLNISANASISLNSIMSNGQSVTCTLLNTNGPTGYYANAFSIDGVSVSPKYIGPAPVSGINNGIDSYTLNIIKTDAATYTVLVSIIGFS
jgi:hypothetical protein